MEPELDYSLLAAKLVPPVFRLMGPIGLIPAFAGLTVGTHHAARHGLARRVGGLRDETLPRPVHGDLRGYGDFLHLQRTSSPPETRKHP